MTTTFKNFARLLKKNKIEKIRPSIKALTKKTKTWSTKNK